MEEDIWVPNITPCVCSWTDLLGFASFLKKYNWSLTEFRQRLFDKFPENYAVGYAEVSRLHHMQLSTHMTIDPWCETAMVINDGIARTVDVPAALKDPLPLLSWLREVVFKHESYNRQDKGSGFPGVRTVVSFGDRMDFSYENSSLRDYVRRDVPNDRTVVYAPRPFQNNVAFAKAYLIDAFVSRYFPKQPKNSIFLERGVLELLRDRLHEKEFLVRYYEYGRHFPSRVNLKFLTVFERNKFTISRVIEGDTRVLITLRLSDILHLREERVEADVLQLVRHRFFFENYEGPI